MKTLVLTSEKELRYTLLLKQATETELTISIVCENTVQEIEDILNCDEDVKIIAKEVDYPIYSVYNNFTKDRNGIVTIKLLKDSIETELEKQQCEIEELRTLIIDTLYGSSESESEVVENNE